MKEISPEKMARNWKSMIMISHDFFHRWRQVAEESLGKQETQKMINSFWEKVGRSTAESYLGKNRDPENVEEVVQAFARASEVMGEKVKVVQDDRFVLLIHDECPWIDSFKNYGAPGECQEGCDSWFKSAVQGISPNLKVETTSCLASGESTCTRRFSKGR
ncbi:MAG: L-2-amino-thiazoline-4-carboxylic acid hydrolase [Clostridia bacterium]|nr:L-2-amino-thiazoline-4-carboxylic acid hydrolase [Clostridia bacterium]